jgi:hypothetical protein
MRSIVVAAVLSLLVVPLAIAQDSFTPGSDDTLKWVEPGKGLEQMAEEATTGILYVYSSGKVEFCKALEKEVFPSKSLARMLEKVVCMKLSSDKESDTLSAYKLDVGDAAVLFLDCQGKVIETLKEKPDASKFSAALRKVDKENKKIRDFLKKIEASYEKGEAYFKKKMFHKAAEQFRAIGKAKEQYEEKKGELKSPYFEKARKKLDQIEEEGQKLLIQANAAINKDDFINADALLSQIRREFSLFENIMTKLKQSEEELQRRMERAQQGTGK